MSKPRFQYGGHATFPVRYGWLPKGLGTLFGEDGYVANTATADALGLGSKMVDSLGYWLEVTGISEARDATRTPLRPSAVGQLIAAHDPYFELPGTWWFLHLGLARCEGTVWSWFFNDYSDRLFDRIASIDAFIQHTRSHAQRPATVGAAQRDIGCLIGSYAARPGVDIVDASEVGACPFRELGLVLRHDAVNRFERARTPRAVPMEVFLASASLLAADLEKSAISLRELASARKGPGRLLCMGFDAIDEMVGDIGIAADGSPFRVETSAGERELVIEARPTSYWLERLYDRLAAENTAVAA